MTVLQKGFLEVLSFTGDFDVFFYHMLSYDVIIIINNYIINNLSFTDRFQGRGFVLIFSLFTNHLQDILTYLFSF
jgi:hypothetical protein